MITQTAMTLLFGTAADAQYRNRASGAIAAMLGACFMLYPGLAGPHVHRAFFAHAGGFLFGVLATRVFTGVGRIAPQTQ
jgi:membrane associated rhomboid family serine protease